LQQGLTLRRVPFSLTEPISSGTDRSWESDAAEADSGAFTRLDAGKTADDAKALCRYNSTLRNCFPGNCRIMPFISKSKRVARTPEEFKPEDSTMSSICLGASAVRSH